MKKNNKKSKKENLIETKKYEIFNIVKNNETKEIFIALGNYIVQNGFDTIKSAKTYIDTKPYELIATMISVITNEINKIK